ncbi:MAG: phytoene/squalene synthase family protein [Bacteroidetes bacterium]|nr:phytoene/squalene synthase family protein [Bacteroidota bacterium]
MKQLFDELSAECSRMVTRKYSTSFSAGIYFFPPQTRASIYSVYGFVRLADEIVDSFDGYPQAALLAKFVESTEEAIDDGISLNPVLNAFQETVNRYNMPGELITLFFRSMEMDLRQTNYDDASYRQYINGSAEAVGLMCLCVFVDGDAALYEALRPYAASFGAALQKVNFLRDFRDDYQRLGRVYFPQIDFSRFSGADKQAIEKDIEADFEQALLGIRRLPAPVRKGVYVAYRYYLSLFEDIRKATAAEIAGKRIRLSNARKIWLAFEAVLRHEFNRI